jgi:activator of HSP90 ATPase
MTIIEKSILLSIDKENLYSKLLDEDFVPLYMGCSIRHISNNEYEWYMKKDNQDIVLLTGQVINKVNNQMLEIKTYNPHRNYKEKHYLNVKYILENLDNLTKLTIIQSGFDGLPDGQTVYKENLKGWDYALKNLKEQINQKK